MNAVSHRSALLLAGALLLTSIALNPWGCGRTQGLGSAERGDWGLSARERSEPRGEEQAVLTRAPRCHHPWCGTTRAAWS